MDATESPGPSPARRRWRPDPWLVAVAGVAAIAAISYVVLDEEPEPEEGFCTADGHLNPTYHRDPDQDCLWVDEDGNVVPDQ
jgi:hypothetical protein